MDESSPPLHPLSLCFGASGVGGYGSSSSGRDMEAGAVSVRLHHGGPQGAKPKGEVVADILAAIREWRA